MHQSARLFPTPKDVRPPSGHEGCRVAVKAALGGAARISVAHADIARYICVHQRGARMIPVCNAVPDRRPAIR